MDVLLPDPGDEEHLVVHGQAEQDAHQQDREEGDHGHPAFQVHELLEVSLVEYQRGSAEGSADRQQEAERGLDRHPHRPEDGGQQHQRQPDHERAEGQ